MNLKSILLALLVILIWGTNFAVVKGAVAEIPPLAFLTLRFFLTSIVASFFVDWKNFKQEWKGLFVVGFLMGILHQGTMFTGLLFAEAGVMSILLQIQVIIVTLMGYFFFKEKIGWRSWIGISLGFLGVLVLIIPTLKGGGDSSIYAYILGIFSAFSLALAYFKMKKFETINVANFIFGINATIVPAIFLTSIVIEGSEWIPNLPTLNWSIIGPALAFQVIALSLSHAIWQRLLVKNPVSLVVPWCLLVPVIGVIAGIILLDEILTPSIIIGGVLTISGVGIVTFRRIKQGKTVIETD
jgi:O-acetylserine/cysteine efflux transporter